MENSLHEGLRKNLDHSYSSMEKSLCAMVSAMADGDFQAVKEASMRMEGCVASMTHYTCRENFSNMSIEEEQAVKSYLTAKTAELSEALAFSALPHTERWARWTVNLARKAVRAKWRGAIHDAWITGGYRLHWLDHLAGELQAIRNIYGGSWLASLRNKDLDAARETHRPPKV